MAKKKICIEYLSCKNGITQFYKPTYEKESMISIVISVCQAKGIAGAHFNDSLFVRSEDVNALVKRLKNYTLIHVQEMIHFTPNFEKD